jgi:hypothetical protein
MLSWMQLAGLMALQFFGPTIISIGESLSLKSPAHINFPLCSPRTATASCNVFAGSDNCSDDPSLQNRIVVPGNTAIGSRGSPSLVFQPEDSSKSLRNIAKNIASELSLTVETTASPFVPLSRIAFALSRPSFVICLGSTTVFLSSINDFSASACLVLASASEISTSCCDFIASEASFCSPRIVSACLLFAIREVITTPAPATNVRANNTTDDHSKNDFQLSTEDRSFIILVSVCAGIVGVVATGTVIFLIVYNRRGINSSTTARPFGHATASIDIHHAGKFAYFRRGTRPSTRTP